MLGANRGEVEGETLSIEDARNRPLGEITKLDEKCREKQGQLLRLGRGLYLLGQVGK